jgi:hypothetical protein
MSDDLEQSIAQLAETVSDKFPVITLVSGERLLVREVQLYDEQTVAEISRLRTKAATKLQGFSTGIGFWGKPSWVIEGTTALDDARDDVVGAARRKRDDPVHRPRRVGLRSCDPRHSRERGSTRCELQKSAAAE